MFAFYIITYDLLLFLDGIYRICCKAADLPYFIANKSFEEYCAVHVWYVIIAHALLAFSAWRLRGFFVTL
ncbi:hypothetical protein, partial [Staphylococcus aureus]